MSAALFIDGAVGTTGLEIAERVAGRSEFTLIALGEDARKNIAKRREALNAADFVILCLPDDAAREAAGLIDNPRTRVIDASSAHRVDPAWTFGFPEIVGRDKVAGAARVSNPGCYSTGFIALVAPLVRQGLIPGDWAYTCHAVSGYSGGGKALIARFEGDPGIAYRDYALALGHKHVPEMQHVAGLAHPPLFAPAVVAAHRGMIVEVPLHLSLMHHAAPVDGLRDLLKDYYRDSAVVHVHEDAPEELLLRGDAPGWDGLDLYVCGSPDGTQARLIAVLDNLGKGASGAAVQNLNLMSGLPETQGLRLR